MDKSKTPMTPKDAGRIQAVADRTGTNQDFKARAQRAAAKNGNRGSGKPGGKGK